MSDSLLNEQKDIYRKNFLEHGDTPEGVFWNNLETQHLRFNRLLKNFGLTSPFSIHDIGCGTCNLHEYLQQNNIKHDYHGTEIVPEMVETAKKKFPGIKVFERNMLTEQNIETCDIGVVSGTFNLGGNSDADQWKKYVFGIMKKLFSVSSRGSAYNFLTTYKTRTDPFLSYFNPAEVFDFCMKNLSRFVILDHAYPFYEFTITVYQEDFLEKEYPGHVYQKYFNR